MLEESVKDQQICPAGEISAYIDGELSPAAELELELHFAGCADCTRILNEQKTMLLALDRGLGDPVLELPDDFSRSVVAHAESRVSGLRRPNEMIHAVLICIGLLAFVSIALSGGSAGTFAAAGSLLQAAVSITAAAGHFVYDISLGSTVIFRTLFSSFVGGSAAIAFLTAVLFAGALLALTRLFSRPNGA